ncbi:hypothetical protein B5807_02620 [Epicoccum nigrum]|uniref:Uncharacterized protein n=1 Tax=Epicoccum nigrum TaxID=105696 RepID=A0A1Y2M977_EPING|nr:hypothetical protein B5807_02620 [Epicoccum nigrum]
MELKGERKKTTQWREGDVCIVSVDSKAGSKNSAAEEGETPNVLRPRLETLPRPRAFLAQLVCRKGGEGGPGGIAAPWLRCGERLGEAGEGDLRGCCSPRAGRGAGSPQPPGAGTRFSKKAAFSLGGRGGGFSDEASDSEQCAAFSPPASGLQPPRLLLEIPVEDAQLGSLPHRLAHVAHHRLACPARSVQIRQRRGPCGPQPQPQTQPGLPAETPRRAAAAVQTAPSAAAGDLPGPQAAHDLPHLDAFLGPRGEHPLDDGEPLGLDLELAQAAARAGEAGAQRGVCGRDEAVAPRGDLVEVSVERRVVGRARSVLRERGQGLVLRDGKDGEEDAAQAEHVCGALPP